MMTEWVQMLRTRLAVALAGHLTADLGQHLGGARTEVLLVDATLEVLADLEVVERDPVLEETGVDGVGQRLQQQEGLPRLVFVDAHDAVAQIVVLAKDVGVGVVQFVVGVLPHVGRRGVVPLPGGGVDRGVAHPIPLAVHDIVAEFHVLDDLRHRQTDGSGQPGRWEEREQQYRAAAEFQAALGGDDGADVGGIALTATGDDLFADGVEFGAEVLDVLGAEVGDRVGGHALQGGHGGVLSGRWSF
jgi:hypothetical protein